MQGLIIRWLINAFSLLLVGYLLPGFRVESFFSALVASLFLGVLNAIVRPILIILTLPLTLLTLGFFILVINGLMLYILDGVIKGIQIDSFWSAFFWGFDNKRDRLADEFLCERAWPNPLC